MVADYQGTRDQSGVMRPTLHDGFGSGTIGGFCKLVTVTESVILSRILRRWPAAVH
jgi:hypothetical protein